ncbi:hypothetical protein CC85DRAFT_330812 [Cutaneotrichosporon oleaginosum]|uniref:Uncharacterized protein n=1 Tax=Cutaneotrichosporon oleaginosum TaxID=879819 RepID=A0A0J0XE15_9TREE|nr:uncharacterized protein CC85DRAFT_330812 [Cutaneotrichosporon oleaginosum]KLT39322.1 hypothetical protein CC85DRAFT_330812 [Cutaneotrichosporon oleaginosum]TXT08518.1 hypothetical protein COLE_05442 [Cutaneotrichosporon oleaginosum]
MKVKLRKNPPPPSPRLHSGYKAIRPRWGRSAKPVPAAVRKRLMAAAAVTKQAAAATAKNPIPTASVNATSTAKSFATPTRAGVSTAYPTPPRTTTPKQRTRRSPAPSPTTARMQPQPTLRAVLASRGISGTAADISDGYEWSPIELADDVSRQLWPEACPPPNDCPSWAAGMRRDIDAAAVAARTRTAQRKAEGVLPTPSPSSPHPARMWPANQPPSRSTSPIYQPPSHSTTPHQASYRPSPLARTAATSRSVVYMPAPQFTELPSPVPNVTRRRPAWTRPGGPLPPFLTPDQLPANFEDHRWNMAYVVHEVAGLEWHEECLCMDCDDTALRRVGTVPKIWPGFEVDNPFLVAYFNGE